MISPGITTGPAPLHQTNLVVADLIDKNTKEWNVGKLKDLFPDLWPEIMQIRPSKMDSPDRLIWLHTKDGTYSTRSGYYKALETRVGEQAAVQSNGFAWKKLIWNLQCPPKIHMFLWRVARATLPVGTNLLRRKVTTTANCIRCGEEESEMHLLFHCPFARTVWDKAPLTTPLNVNSINDLKVGLSICSTIQRQQSSSETKLLTAPWILWSISASRNKKIFENRTLTAEDTLDIAITAEEEWHKAQLDSKTTTDQPRQAPTRIQNRQGADCDDLLPGTIICQTDAAWAQQGSIAGLGWVTLDRNRGVKAKHCKPVTFVKGPSEAEALCIFEALRSLQNQQEERIIIESDAKNVITAITSHKPPINLRGTVEGILKLAKSFRALSYKFIPRSENSLADELAKTAVRSMTIGLSTSTFV